MHSRNALREEHIQDIPIAVTALGAESMAESSGDASRSSNGTTDMICPVCQ